MGSGGCGALGAALLALLLLPAPGAARDFRVGEVEGILNLSLGYGLRVRVADRDENIVGIANGGDARSVNFDDGNLNNGQGIASNVFQGSAELGLRWKGFGAFARAFGFYDVENRNRPRERTRLSGKGRRLVARDFELRDHYLSTRFSLAGIPIQLRVGDQVINWGESDFLRFGVDVVNPVDLRSIGRPASTPRDLFLPQGMVWAVANLTETFAFEAFYQYDWQEVPTAPVGSFFSINDTYGGDGTASAFVGDGQFSDLGTDLDAAFGLPRGTLGFDRDFLRIRGRGRDEPTSQGQWGLAVQAFFSQLNSTKVGLHFVNYHSRQALLSGETASAAAVAETSEPAVEARAAELAPIYEATGLDPDEAAEAADATASLLTVSGLANESGYVATFPKNIRMLGLTFNTAMVRTGTLLSGEISHHFDFPFQVLSSAVLQATLSPLLSDSSFREGPLGGFGPDATVRGYVEKGKTQLAFGVTQLFGPRLGAAQSLIRLDLGWVHVHDMPRRSRLPLNAPGITRTGDVGQPLPRNRLPSADSLGYRVIGTLRYTSVLGGFNVAPRVVFTHDFHGVTPGPLSAYIEDRMSLNVGVGIDYLNTWTVDLGYTSFFGGGRYNLLRDRDSFRLNLSYFY